MEKLFLAKTKDRQSIIDHTEDLYYYYEEFIKRFPERLTPQEFEMLRISILFHDMGKINRKFQHKIYQKLDLPFWCEVDEDRDEVPHGYLSPSFIDADALKEKFQSDEAVAVVIAAIMKHHERGPLDIARKREILRIIQEELPLDSEGFDYIKIQSLKAGPQYWYGQYLNYMLKKDVTSEEGKSFVKVKGYLNKFDYLASGFGKTADFEQDIRDEGKTIEEKMKHKMDEAQWKINSLQETLIAHRNQSGILVASTGMGKTEGALFWLSDSKAYFTLPLKVSINAIYRRIKEEYQYQKVEIIHSSMAEEYMQEKDYLDGDILRRINEAKLQVNPLIVTTVDQIFKFVFLYNGFEMQLAELSHAKVVIDEIQMYDPNILACLIRGIQLIEAYGGKFLIMTATMPKYVENLMKEEGICGEHHFREKHLLPEHKCYQRHWIKFLDAKFPAQKIRMLGRHHKVLVIANTVSKAQEIYAELKEEGQNLHLLHGKFIKKDRELLERKIFDFTDKNNKDSEDTGIWIATQIVEASLDIDFDILFTEMCSIDSLIQRLGRVFRKRFFWTASFPNVYIVNSENTGGGKVIDIELYQASLNTLIQYDNQFITEEMKQNMVDDVFDENKNPSIIRYKDKVKLKLKGLKELRLHSTIKKEIQAQFRDIDNINCIPISVYKQIVQKGVLREIEKKLSSTEDKKTSILAINELMGYTVSVRRNAKEISEAPEDFLRQRAIGIIHCKYEFDEETYSGRGLVLKETVDENFF